MALLDLLRLPSIAANLFWRRSHESLLLVSNADYHVWRVMPFIAALPCGGGRFEVRFWSAVGAPFELHLLESVSAAAQAIRNAISPKGPGIG